MFVCMLWQAWNADETVSSAKCCPRPNIELDGGERERKNLSDLGHVYNNII